MWKLLLTALFVVIMADRIAFVERESRPIYRHTIETTENVKEPEFINLLKNVSIDPVEMLDPNDISCMTQNIYFEARNQSKEGKYAVAEVVMNRMNDSRFPNNVCEVIKEQTEKVCQFSWYCDGKSDRMTDVAAIEEAREIAIDVLLSDPTDYTKGALFYHANYVNPEWKNVKETAVIEDHIFYTKT